MKASLAGMVNFEPVGGKSRTSDRENPRLPPLQIPPWYREVFAQAECSLWLTVTLLYCCLFVFYLFIVISSIFCFFSDATISGELKTVIDLGLQLLYNISLPKILLKMI